MELELELELEVGEELELEVEVEEMEVGEELELEVEVEEMEVEALAQAPALPGGPPLSPALGGREEVRWVWIRGRVPLGGREEVRWVTRRRKPKELCLKNRRRKLEFRRLKRVQQLNKVINGQR